MVQDDLANNFMNPPPWQAVQQARRAQRIQRCQAGKQSCTECPLLIL